MHLTTSDRFSTRVPKNLVPGPCKRLLRPASSHDFSHIFIAERRVWGETGPLDSR